MLRMRCTSIPVSSHLWYFTLSAIRTDTWLRLILSKLSVRESRRKPFFSRENNVNASSSFFLLPPRIRFNWETNVKPSAMPIGRNWEHMPCYIIPSGLALFATFHFFFRKKDFRRFKTFGSNFSSRKKKLEIFNNNLFCWKICLDRVLFSQLRRIWDLDIYTILYYVMQRKITRHLSGVTNYVIKIWALGVEWIFRACFKALSKLFEFVKTSWREFFFPFTNKDIFIKQRKWLKKFFIHKKNKCKHY